MAKVENSLEAQLPQSPTGNSDEPHELLAQVDTLDAGIANEEQQVVVEEIRQALLALPER